MTPAEALAHLATLKAERTAIWSTVTGSTTHADDTLEVHGVTGAQISRVAKINGEIVRLARHFDLYAHGI